MRPGKALEPRERTAILRMARRGLTPKQISQRVNRYEGTVRHFMVQAGVWVLRQNNEQREELEGQSDPSLEELHLRCHAFRMFSQGDSINQVATALRISRKQAADLARECPPWWGSEANQ